jgi:hypothetical protein
MATEERKRLSNGDLDELVAAANDLLSRDALIAQTGHLGRAVIRSVSPLVSDVRQLRKEIAAMMRLLAKYVEYDGNGSEPPWRSDLDAEAEKLLRDYHCLECNSYHVDDAECLYHYKNPDDL